MGVHPDYRSTGVGYALKQYQRQFVCGQSLDLVTWTYDPLDELHNAQLNIANLGGICNTYRRNVYGELRDGLNAGLPTDRFLVDWWVASDRVERRVQRMDDRQSTIVGLLTSSALIVNPPGPDGTPRPPSPEGFDHGPTDAPVLLEIPADFLALKAADRTLAAAWRLGHARRLRGALRRRPGRDRFRVRARATAPRRLRPDAACITKRFTTEAVRSLPVGREHGDP